MNIVETFSHRGIDVRMTETDGMYQCRMVPLGCAVFDTDRDRCRSTMVKLIDELDGRVGWELYRGFKITYRSFGTSYAAVITLNGLVEAKTSGSLLLSNAVSSAHMAADGLIPERLLSLKQELREAIDSDSDDWVETLRYIMNEVEELNATATKR